MKPTSNRRQMTPREASDGINELIRAGFITVVRVRRDGGRVIQSLPGADEWFEAVAVYVMARDGGTVTEAHRKKSAKRG